MPKFKRLLPVFLLTLVNVFSFALLIPVYPFLIRQFGDPEIVLGGLMALFSIFQFLGAPLMGSLSDRFGRKPILLLTQFGTFLSWCLFITAYFVGSDKVLGLISMPMLVIAFSRVVDGITGGNVSVTNAYLSDITKKEERTVVFGYVGATFGIGMIIGPALGSFAMGFGIGFLGTALVGATISLLTLISMMVWLQESLPSSKRTAEVDGHILQQLNIVRKLRKWKHVHIITTALSFRLITGTVLGGYASIIALYVIDRFELDERQLAFFLLFVGTFLIINQSFLVKRFVQRFGDLKTLVAGQCLMALGLFAMGMAPTLPLFIAAYYLNNLGLSLSLPTLQAIITKNADDKSQGEVLGLNDSMGSLSSMYAPIVATSLYSVFSGKTFWFFSATALVGLVWFWARCRTIRRKEKCRL